MDLTKRKSAKDEPSGRAYFFREGIEVCLVLGGLAIAESFVRVPPWLWILLPAVKLLVSILFYFLFVKKILKRSSHHGAQSLIGQNARTLVALDPVGQIKIGSEIWTARNQTNQIIASGQHVVICGISGKLLLVEEVQKET